MKLQEILEQEQLDEAPKGAIAAGLLGGAAGIWGAHNIQSAMNPHQERPAIVQQQQRAAPELGEIHPNLKRIDLKQQAQVNRITNKYDVDKELVQQIVELAHKYEKPVFPKAQDILSIVGIESSFDPEAVSRLRKDPAVGLMQVRPGVWNIDPSEMNDVEAQIRHGSEILQWYYQKLHNKEAAIQAYNVGLTDYRQGVGAPEYLQKFHNERQLYAGI